MAFINSFVPSTSLAVSSFSASAAPLRPRLSRHASVRMATGQDKKPAAKDTTFTSIEENRVAKQQAAYRGPQGFTPYAEKVNGRLAQLGFFIGLVTEIASGKGILEQIFIMFSPITNFFHLGM